MTISVPSSHPAEPWLDRWEIVGDLSHGGQGYTKVVRPSDPTAMPPKGVLKILKHQDSLEARRRMYAETKNLVILHSAGCRVPRVLEGDLERFEDLGVPLFFVMEFVEGVTLADHVQKLGHLALKEASDIALNICETLALAQKEGIQHRDIKPENLLLCGSGVGATNAKQDIVIVDYGLSFNEAVPDPLTRSSETLDNSFLSLPERRVMGGNRRDPRSDVTGLCGILFYCISGQKPVDLVDSRGLPPHRRPGVSMENILTDSVARRLLNALFERGFKSNIDDRFQSPEEFAGHLREVLNPNIRTANEDTVRAADRISRELRQNYRKAQLALYQEKASNFSQAVLLCRQEFEGKLASFEFTGYGTMPGFWDVADHDEVGPQQAIGIRQRQHQGYAAIAYQIRARGTECVVFRGLFFSHDGKAPLRPVATPWVPILRYDGESEQDFSVITGDCRAMIGEAMEFLKEMIFTLAKEPLRYETASSAPEVRGIEYPTGRDRDGVHAIVRALVRLNGEDTEQNLQVTIKENYISTQGFIDRGVGHALFARTQVKGLPGVAIMPFGREYAIREKLV